MRPRANRRSSQGMDDRPGAFRHRRIEKINAYRRHWVDPKEQDKSRRHQRATADAGQPDDEANASSENDVLKIEWHLVREGLRSGGHRLKLCPTRRGLPGARGQIQSSSYRSIFDGSDRTLVSSFTLLRFLTPTVFCRCWPTSALVRIADSSRAPREVRKVPNSRRWRWAPNATGSRANSLFAGLTQRN
jgi:hypothetical protein